MSFYTFYDRRSPRGPSLHPGHTVRVIGIPKLLPPKLSCDPTTPHHHQGNGQNERYNGIVWKAVQCPLHTANRPLSDWKYVLPSTFSLIRTLVKTITTETSDDRFFCFKRVESLIRLFRSPPWLKQTLPRTSGIS